MSYRIVDTGDQSNTVYDENYHEHMHSISGAYEEALLKHIYPSEVLLTKKKSVTVLDIGFGLGYNILALLREAERLNSSALIEIISLEQKEDLADTLDRICFSDERNIIYEFIKAAYRGERQSFRRFSISVIIGDARDSIQKVSSSLDAVLHDPYSPAKNPELWSVEFFSYLHRIMVAKGVLTTYSSSLKIRRALFEAGFQIAKGPSVGMKREGTLAYKSGDHNCFNNEEIESILSSGKAIPYRDHELSTCREEIIERRNKELNAFRGKM